VDGEHSPIELRDLIGILQAAEAYPITPLVRVAANDIVRIKQVLDTGAQNILVPMVSSVAEAQAAADAVHYPPRGGRGVGSALARSARWNRVDGYLQNAAEHMSLIVQAETAEAVEHAAEIAAVDGIDGVFVGPSDLAASRGLLGQQSHPDVVAAVHRVFEAVHAAGKPVGVNAFDPAVADSYIQAGADFVAVGADVSLLARGSEALAARFIPDGADATSTPRASY
jgi:4-hydroxy-2-oxoheptanedioate aldolase